MTKEMSDPKIVEMIRDGFSAYQIGLQLGLMDAEVRSIAKKHRLGKQLMANEGCTVRQATAEELAAYGADKKPNAQKSKPELPEPKLELEVEPNEELRNAYQIVRDDIQRLRQTLNTTEKFLALRLDSELGR